MFNKNVAFITTYFRGYWFRDKSVYGVNNGFSFVDHLFKNHEHFFIDMSSKQTLFNDIIFLKKELKKFNTIYLSIADTTHELFGYLCELIDERFIVGGPPFKLLDTSKIEKITGARFIKGTFENYLNIPLQTKFTNYWEDILGTNKKYQFIINYSSACYNKCTFCNYGSIENDDRDLENIINQAITNTSIKYIFLTKPSLDINDLNIIRRIHKNLIKTNTMLFCFIRSDKKIYDYIDNNFEDLTNLEFFNGLEFFSNSCLERVNKNTTVENAYNLGKMILKKNGKILYSCIKCSPIFTDKDLLESIQNYKLFKELLINNEKVFFMMGEYLTFYNIDNHPMFSNFYDYKVFHMINNNRIRFAKSNTESDYINNNIFTEMLNRLNLLNFEKLKLYHKNNGI